MKKLLVIIITTICFSCRSYNVTENSATCLLFPKHHPALIFKKAGNCIIDTIINDTIKENYVLLNILKINHRYAKVEVQYTLSEKREIGWIEKKHLGIYPVSTPIIYLYSSPQKGSNICDSLIDANWGKLLTIDKHRKGWLYIKNELHHGWMAPNDQCSNPYSSCN